MSEPTVVLVHGAWHGAWCWAALQAELDLRGIPSLALDLPGHGGSTEELGGLHTDSGHVVKALDRIGGPAILVGHSYGGAVITEAGAAAQNVAHLVYVAAYCIDEGESAGGKAASLPPATTRLGTAGSMSPDGLSVVIDRDQAAACFYHRCPEPVARANSARLGPQLLASVSEPAQGAAWRSIPSTYVICLDDQALHPDHQRIMAEQCGSTVSIDTDHSPFASATKETADIITAVVNGL